MCPDVMYFILCFDRKILTCTSNSYTKETQKCAAALCCNEKRVDSDFPILYSHWPLNFIESEKGHKAL